jgi:hypothetical protein
VFTELEMGSLTDDAFLQLSRAKAGFGELYRDNKRHSEREEQAAQLLDKAVDRIESLERFAHGQAHWIDDLRSQVSELRGEPIPPSVLLSPSLGSEEEVADDEADAEAEAEVSTLVEAPYSRKSRDRSIRRL